MVRDFQEGGAQRWRAGQERQFAFSLQVARQQCRKTSEMKMKDQGIIIHGSSFAVCRWIDEAGADTSEERGLSCRDAAEFDLPLQVNCPEPIKSRIAPRFPVIEPLNLEILQQSRDAARVVLVRVRQHNSIQLAHPRPPEVPADYSLSDIKRVAPGFRRRV